jgi:simple sugar transport system ATP-binding protein/simple sugar transport system permease protein
MTVSLGTDQIVTAVAVNLMMVGFTGVIFRLLKTHLAETGRSGGLSAASFPTVSIPLLKEIPLIGPVLFEHLIPVYLTFLLVPICHFILYRTTWGLSIRAVGENPRAADTLGVKVLKVRYLVVIWSGVLSAAGGAVLSIGHNSTFIENMVAGRGFIAFSAIVFGRWTAVGTLGASLLFGFADAFQLRLQAGIFSSYLTSIGISDIPYQFPVMLPYVITLVALLFTGRAYWPAAAGTSYKREVS